MRNSILMGIMLSCTILGGVIGSTIQADRDAAEIEAAWDDITVVKDGTLIANPAAYAYDPSSLAKADHLTISSNRSAGAEQALHDYLSSTN